MVFVTCLPLSTRNHHCAVVLGPCLASSEVARLPLMRRCVLPCGAFCLLAEDKRSTSSPDAGPARMRADVAKQKAQPQPKPRAAFSLYRDAWTDPIIKGIKVQQEWDGKSRRALEYQNSTHRDKVLEWARASGNHDGL